MRQVFFGWGPLGLTLTWWGCYSVPFYQRQKPKELAHSFYSVLVAISVFVAEPLWTDPGIKSGISVHELISTLKKKKAQAGDDWLNILPKSLQARKKPPDALHFG